MSLDVGQTGTFSPVTVSDPNKNYYQTWTLTTGALVDVQVTARNVNGESAKSDVRAFYVATIPSTSATPTQTNIYLTNGYSNPDSAIQVSWVTPASNGAPITDYQLFMAVNSELYNLIYDGSGRADILTYTQT